MLLFILKNLITDTPEHAFIYFKKFSNNRHARTYLYNHTLFVLKSLIIIGMPEHAFNLKTSQQLMIYIKTFKRISDQYFLWYFLFIIKKILIWGIIEMYVKFLLEIWVQLSEYFDLSGNIENMCLVIHIVLLKNVKIN